ncbi:MAG: transcriptional repressor [Deltaproteobacteria bacterium]|nr:transcriptional repressor [Deltaproteobacteria bacterium]
MEDNSDLQWFWDTLDAHLSRQQLKQTKQRKVIVEHFLRLARHVDAEDLYRRVRGKGFKIGLATIYRTLNLLRDADLVTQHSFTDGRAIFEIKRPGTHHDHMVCSLCGIIQEFENDQIEVLQSKVAEDHGFTLTSHRLDLFGVCRGCHNEQSQQ